MKIVKIINQSNSTNPITAFVCDKFITKFLGLMFRKEVSIDSGMLFIESSESRLNTSIHMFFMRFDIAVLWMDKKYTIVDKTIARKWHPFYIPARPAQYTLEIHTSRFADFNIGDQLKVLND